MIFLHTFLESIKLPSRQALFKLNRKGMDIVVFYMFILLFIVSIPAFIDQIAANNVSYTKMNIFFLIIYFFIFYYLPLNVIVFGFLSLVAYIGVGITKLMKRKLRFAILWKMTAFTTTIPFLIYTLFALFMPISNTFLWFSLLYTLGMLIKMISVYPRRKIQS